MSRKLAKQVREELWPERLRRAVEREINTRTLTQSFRPASSCSHCTTTGHSRRTCPHLILTPV